MAEPAASETVETPAPAVAEPVPEPAPDVPAAASDPTPSADTPEEVLPEPEPAAEPALEPEQPAAAPAPATTPADTDDAPDTAEEPEVAPAPATPTPQIASDPPAEPKIADEPEVARPDASSDGDAPEPIEPVRPEQGAKDAPAADAARVQPLTQYAEPLDNPDGKPLMSIVLIDDGTAEEAADLPYPVTFAVDPTLPDAAERMARHRANGFEVVALMDLPEGTSPDDVDATLASGLAALPEAVALLEAPDGTVQADRALSDRVTQSVAASGHGLILQPSGRDTVQKLAAQEGVASAVVFRDLDGDGQTPEVMSRFLDQAALRAGQRQDVIVVARMRPDTVSALVQWGLQDRAARVVMAPVSHLLSPQSED